MRELADLLESHVRFEERLGVIEGQLAKLRAAVVNMTALADVARSLGLGSVILLGKGAATRMILTGDPVRGSEAVELGVVQWAVPRDQLAEIRNRRVGYRGVAPCRRECPEDSAPREQ